MMIIDCQYKSLVRLPDIPSCWLSEEPAFYGLADDVTGKIGRAFVQSLPPEARRRRMEIEVRVRYLKKGWCMGGDNYHFDLSHVRVDGNADPSRWLLAGDHTYLASVGDVALTRVLVGPVELPDVPLNQPQDRLWDQLIRLRVARGTLLEHTIPDGQIVRIGNVLHAASPAHRAGIRVFLRARPEVTAFEGVDFHRPQQNIYRPDMSSRSPCEALLAAPYFPRRLLDF